MLRRNPVSNSFYCANKSYTSDLKLKLLRGRNEHLENQGRIMATLAPVAYLCKKASMTKFKFAPFFTI